jgi:flagellin
MRINTNVSALNAFRNLSRVEGNVADSMQKLSSGLRINKAADDAAGLGIANTLRSSTRALNQAAQNAEQASAMLQVAEGSTSAIESILERMKELAAQSASSNSGDRVQLQSEFNTLRTEITRIVNTTDYQGNKLIDGSLGTKLDVVGNWTLDNSADVQASTIKATGAPAGTFTLAVADATHLSATDANGNVQVVQVVATGAQSVSFSQFGISFTTASTFDTGDASHDLHGDTVQVVAGAHAADFLVSASSGAYAGNDLVSLSSAIDLTTGSSGLNISGADISSQSAAQTALASLDTAIGTVNSALGTIGATQSRIGFALDTTKTAIQNFTAAESTIRDVDMAEEMTKFSKNQILAQAGTAMLAQANQSGASVLKLLQ